MTILSQDKIITRLRDRRQIETALHQMVSAHSETEFRNLARQIADLGAEVVPVLVRGLDRADGPMLEALGTVATFLDREEVSKALRWALRQPQQTQQGRQAAVAILERFLGETVEADLRPTLAEAQQAALVALAELLEQPLDESPLLIDYVEGLDRQQPDVVLAVIRALRLSGKLRAIELLRMLAQDVREEIAAEALQALGSIRTPEAARALQTLIPISAPTLSPVAERLLRKLQFAGVQVEVLPQPAPEWRALVSPVDGHGQQSVWLILESRWAAHARFLNVLMSDRLGAVEARGHGQMPLALLPLRRPRGWVHELSVHGGSGGILMLEGSFDWGRRLLVNALAQNRATQVPVAGALRLLSPWLWGVADSDAGVTPMLPQLCAEDRAAGKTSAHLLDQPPFDGWTALTELSLQAAEQALVRPAWDLEMWVRRLAGEWLGAPGVVERLRRRLEAMSEWLQLANDEPRARLALGTAEAMSEENPERLPFVEALIRRDLERALRTLRVSWTPVFPEERV